MFEMPLEWGKIREFARATGSTNVAYFGPEAIIPPTFLTTSGLAWDEESDALFQSLGFDNSRLLHGEEEYVFPGPPPSAGQVLRGESRIVNRYEKRGKRGGTMRFAVIEREFRNQDDDVVAVQRTTAIETSKPPARGDND